MIGARRATLAGWGHHLAEQLRGSAVDGDFDFGFGDALARGPQLGVSVLVVPANCWVSISS